MTKEELVKLFEAKDSAEKALQAWSAVNIVGKSAEERVEIDLAYERAKVENEKASWAYIDALQKTAAS